MTDTAILPAFLKPCHISTLLRMGKDFDGGYLVDERSVLSSDLLISFGICEDWSFESDFKQIKDVKVLAFDASVSEKLFRKKMRRARYRITKPERLKRQKKIYDSYIKFFSPENDAFHIEYFVGSRRDSNYISMPEVVTKFIGEEYSRVFVKMDIEGWEYRCLEEIVEMSDRMSGLAIEFHDVDIHLDRINDFIKDFPLNLCHLHVNSAAGVDVNGIPFVIELTFTRLEVDEDTEVKLPNEQDMPNLPDKKNFKISFQK